MNDSGNYPPRPKIRGGFIIKDKMVVVYDLGFTDVRQEINENKHHVFSVWSKRIDDNHKEGT